MREFRIPQTLQRINDNLTNLESARTQVNNLTSQTEQLMQAVSELVSNVSSLHEDLIDDEGVLKQSMGTFEENLSTTSDNFSKKASEMLESTKQLQEEMERTQSEIERFDVDKGFSQVFEEVLLLKKTVSDSIEVQNKGFQELESQLKKHSDEQIESTEQLRGEMEQTQSILRSFDYEKGFREVNKEVSILNKSLFESMEAHNKRFQELEIQFSTYADEQKKSSNRNLLFTISGFLILSIGLATIYFL